MVGVGSGVARSRGARHGWLALLMVAVLGAPLAVAARDGRLSEAGAWPLPAGADPGALWLWPDGDRAFLRSDDGVIAIEPATGTELGRVALQPKPWHAQGLNGLYRYASGREHTLAVDEAGGRIFVPYGIDVVREDGRAAWLPFQAAIWGLEAAQNPSGTVDKLTGPTRENTANGQVCVSEAFVQAGGGQCVGGVHVLDAATLQVLGSFPLRQLQPDTAGMAPVLRAVSYASGRQRDGGTVHLLLEDLAHHVDAYAVFAHTQTRSYRVAGRHYLVQLDAATGSQDWSVPVAACAGTRDRVEDPSFAASTSDQPHPAAVLGDRDAISVGCAGAGAERPAVLVRIPLGADERPVGHGLPLPDPAWRVTTVAPSGALEFRADAAAGRLLVRLNPGPACPTPVVPFPCTPAPGERWLAVDAASGTVDGAWAFDTVAETDSAAGFDPRTGRLAVQVDRSGRPATITVVETRRPDRLPVVTTITGNQPANRQGARWSLAARTSQGRLTVYSLATGGARLFRD